MNNITEPNILDLPLPYESFHSAGMERIFHGDIECYRRQLLEWKDENTVTHRSIEDSIDIVMDCAKNTILNKWIRNWMKSHRDKILYLNDLSGMAVMLYVDKRREEFLMSNLGSMSYNYFEKIDGLDASFRDTYKGFSIFKKLDWLYENCEFIPITILKEDLHDMTCSHMWSHIKQDECLMTDLSYYIETVCKGHMPRDEVYYFIKYSTLGYYYLMRDTELSPKKNDVQNRR